MSNPEYAFNSPDDADSVRPELVEGASSEIAEFNYPNNFNSGSIKALYIKLFFNDKQVAHGTGFIGTRHPKREFLLFTAKHNVTAIDFFTNENISKCTKPNKMHVFLPISGNAVSYKEHIINLYKDDSMEKMLPGDELWIEHPNFPTDIVAFKLEDSLLTDLNNICIVEIKLQFPRYSLAPGDSIYVLGFPFKRISNFWAVWTSGSLAFEPSKDFPLVGEDSTGKEVEIHLPVYLINARTFKGQSGSPVVDYPSNQARFKNNDKCWYLDSGASGGILGIYTCRLNPPSEYVDESKQSTDLGIVWKTEVLQGFFTS